MSLHPLPPCTLPSPLPPAPPPQGTLVGITVAPAGSGGLSYAVPIDAVRGLITQILSYGRTTRPALGITMAPPQVGPARQPTKRRTTCSAVRHAACMHLQRTASYTAQH